MPYTPFNPNAVVVGPGTLYAAPIGTTEPASLTAPWGDGWLKLGYTDAGSTFTLTPTNEAVTVAEEVWPIRNVQTGLAGVLAFALAEQTAANIALAFNAGVDGDLNTDAVITNADGSISVETPELGTEKRVMLGWDALPLGATSGTTWGRMIARQGYQTGNIQINRQNGSNKTLISCEFSLEKPQGVQPVRFIVPAALAGNLS